LRVGFIGANYGMKAIYPAIASLSGVDFIGLATRTNKSQAHIASNFLPTNNIPSIPLNRLIDRNHCDLLVVAVPPSSQLEVCNLALENEISVYCEKPVGVSRLQTYSIENYLTLQRSKFFVGFQFRFDPGILWLKDQIESKRVGRILEVKVTWETSGALQIGSHPTWRDDFLQGGGVSREFCSHIFDYLRYISPELFDFLPNFLVLSKLRNHKKSNAFQEIEIVASYPDVKVWMMISRMKTSSAKHSIQIKGENGEIEMCQSAPFGILNLNVVHKDFKIGGRSDKRLELSNFTATGNLSNPNDLRHSALVSLFSDLKMELQNIAYSEKIARIDDAVYSQKCVDKLNDELYN